MKLLLNVSTININSIFFLKALYFRYDSKGQQIIFLLHKIKILVIVMREVCLRTSTTSVSPKPEVKILFSILIQIYFFHILMVTQLICITVLPILYKFCYCLKRDFSTQYWENRGCYHVNSV